MSFALPKNGPEFGDSGWDVKESALASVSRRGARMVRGLLDDSNGGLPMYKDKPYGRTPTKQRRRWWRQSRVQGAVALLVLILLYFTGFFSRRKHPGGSASGWNWLVSSVGEEETDYLKMRDHVVGAFQLSWDAYEKYAMGYDEYHPVSKTGKNMTPKGLGWIIIDSLDTLILMNQTSRLKRAREWVSSTLTWEQDQNVSLFETTIRMMGGLLAAHYLSTEFPELAPLEDDDPGSRGEDLYLEKAKDLADRLISAFESPSGVPYAMANLEKYEGVAATFDMGASSTAEVASVQLEFKYMAKLTGEKNFWDKAERVMEIIDGKEPQDGLVPIFINPVSGEFQGSNIRLGSRGDSYYEYLIKQFLQTNSQEPVYKDMWDETLEGVRKHLITYTRDFRYTVLGERPNGLDGALSPKMDHLVCFYPGTIALAVTGGLTEAEARKQPSWSAKKEKDMQLARELTQTCWGMYKYMATGLAAEITYFEIAEPPLPESAPHDPPGDFDRDPNASWRQDLQVHSNDVHNLQRPETAESLFYMWRITGDVKYREWGWEMFKSFVNHTAVAEGGGFTSLSNANVVPPVVKDNMESFWLAETLKYLYLLFSPDDLLPLDKIVFNTEAHPFPRFDMNPLFSTGWRRKERDGGA